MYWYKGHASGHEIKEHRIWRTVDLIVRGPDIAPKKVDENALVNKLTNILCRAIDRHYSLLLDLCSSVGHFSCDLLELLLLIEI